jgi:hypothetical protein
MPNAIEIVVTAILTLCVLVLHAIGFVDRGLGGAMTGAGIDPQRQMLVLAVLTIVMVGIALRFLGGLLAALLLVLLLLLLLHHAMPDVIYHPSFFTRGLPI